MWNQNMQYNEDVAVKSNIWDHCVELAFHKLIRSHIFHRVMRLEFFVFGTLHGLSR